MRQVIPDDTLVPAATAGEDSRVASLASVGPQGPAVPPAAPAGSPVDTRQETRRNTRRDDRTRPGVA